MTQALLKKMNTSIRKINTYYCCNIDECGHAYWSDGNLIIPVQMKSVLKLYAIIV